MNEYNKFIRFDWAAKRMLRDKANCEAVTSRWQERSGILAVLEGLVQVLIGEPINIMEMQEGEPDREREDYMFNRIDIKAKNSRGEVILVELQQVREWYYRRHMLLDGAKTITELQLARKYDQVKKAYSISIFYFDVGRGADYLYHGQTTLIGMNTGDELRINTKEEDVIRTISPDNISPEYFIIRVNKFDKEAKTPIEEWLSYLKDGYISKDTTVPGLQEAREKLLYISMSDEERRAYDRYLDNVMIQNDVLDTARDEGRAEGLAEGRAERRAEEKKATACRLKALGVELDIIVQATGLTPEEIASL